MARRPQPHVLYSRSRGAGGPWLKRGVWSSWGAADRAHRFGDEYVVLPVQPGDRWPDSFATGADLDADYLARLRQRQAASWASGPATVTIAQAYQLLGVNATRRLTLWRLRYHLECHGFTRQQAGRLLFLRWVAVTRGLIGS